MSSVVLTSRFAMIPEWILYHADLDPLDVRVYGALHRYGDRAFPGLATVATLLHKSPDSIRRAVRRLEQVGAVVVSERHDDAGRQLSNVYLLAGDVPHTCTPGVAQMPGTGVADVPGTGVAQMPPERKPQERKPQQRQEALAGLAVPLAQMPVADAFELFWRTYPRKVGKTGKGGADGAFKRAVARDGVDAISAGSKAWRAYWQADRTDAEFIPMPATWLNQSRYNDTPPAPRRRPQGVLDQLSEMQFDNDGNLVMTGSTGGD